jgi:hypothetical protein
MKPGVLAFFALQLVGANAWSENAPPSDQVINQLLDATNARQERQAVLDRANVRMLPDHWRR